MAWGDVDGDGDPDLYVARSDGFASVLYVNDGRGGFRADTASPATGDAGPSEGAAWVDLDGDGDLDLYAVQRSDQPARLFVNEGGRLRPRTDAVLTAGGRPASMACFADLEGDGDLDVFVTGYRGASNLLAVNDGSGSFRSVELPEAARGGGEARACAWGDLDGNGLPDLFVANARTPNVLLVNRGGVLEPAAPEGMSSRDAYSYGASWADADQDGDLDLFVANFDGANVLWLNDGGVLTAESEDRTPQSAASKGHSWGDFDLDGRLDLYLASGTPAPGQTNRLYRGRADGFEADEAVGWLAHADTSAGAAAADMDGDGDLDLFVANWGSADGPDRLYRNRTTGRAWIVIRPHDQDGNTGGVGAFVSVLATVDGGPRWQHRWIAAATGYAGQDDGGAHFGLGDAARVDSVVVRWPSGTVDRFGGQEVGRVVVLTQGEGRSP